LDFPAALFLHFLPAFVFAAHLAIYLTSFFIKSNTVLSKMQQNIILKNFQ